MFLGFEIEKKTDFLALTAFILSLLGIMNQIRLWADGPNVSLMKMEQILINFDYIGDRKYMRIGATFAYANAGGQGYNAVVAREFVNFKIGEKTFEQRWQKFESFDLEGTKLVSVEQSPARPIPLNAGSGAAHDTYMAPIRKNCPKEQNNCREWDNYITSDKFIEMVKLERSVSFIFTANIYEDEDVSYVCNVQFDKNSISKLESIEWYSPRCSD